MAGARHLTVAYAIGQHPTFTGQAAARGSTLTFELVFMETTRPRFSYAFRVLAPAFCWLVFLTYGLASLEERNYFGAFLLAIGIPALAQSYWSFLKHVRRIERLDWLAFLVSCSAGLFFNLLFFRFLYVNFFG